MSKGKFSQEKMLGAAPGAWHMHGTCRWKEKELALAFAGVYPSQDALLARDSHKVNRLRFG